MRYLDLLKRVAYALVLFIWFGSVILGIVECSKTGFITLGDYTYECKASVKQFFKEQQD